MGKKYQMPTTQEFFQKKKIYWRKYEPVWSYLDREMRENNDKKPYNHKVGEWLKFMRDLHYYFYSEGRRNYRRLDREAGPPWYYELSQKQRGWLDYLRVAIHQDILENIPKRTQHCLHELGIMTKFPSHMLMHTMQNSAEDPGVFIWDLYTAYYKVSPSQLLPKYDMTGMLLMSALVFIDLDECIENLKKLAVRKPRPPPPPPKKPKKFFKPDVQFGDYLQRMYVPCYSNHPKEIKKKPKPMPLDYKIRLRSDESYAELTWRTGFLQKRRERNVIEKQKERRCHYKFWEPPSTLRNTDPKRVAYIQKLKMFKSKGKARYLKMKPPYDNLQCHIGTISYTGDHPHFVLNNYCSLPTGYVPHNGGIVMLGNGEFVTWFLGSWKYPQEDIDKCYSNCNCLEKWDEKVEQFLNDSKCRCGHLYDFGHEGKSKEKYFNKPTKYTPYWFDHNKIYQLDPMDDFIHDTVNEALMSREPTPVNSQPSISPTKLKPRELLAAFLADLADTPLLIPHLPQANLLNNLQQWVRDTVRGPPTPRKHKRMLYQSQRRWLDLKHMDFRARAYMIPFTLKQLQHFNFSHKRIVQELVDQLLNNFTLRNRKKQVEQTRLWWSTMKYDAYPSKGFLDTFFTYLPGRLKDTYVINPYSSERTPKFGAKTCPL